MNRLTQRIGYGLVSRLAALHRDQQGTISILSVFVVLFLVMLLGMVMNVGRHLNAKIRMQNAADAAAYSGAVVIARGMNTLALTNRLLFDVFAVTAFMREARDGDAQPYTQDTLAAWPEVGRKLQTSGFTKFEKAGAAIAKKVPRERELVRTYSRWAKAASEQVLPLMEEILREQMIPEFQRAVVAATGDNAQTAAMEVARRNGEADRRHGTLYGVLWRTSAVPVGGVYEDVNPTLPVVDPVRCAEVERVTYLTRARQQRREMARRHLAQWNYWAMLCFDREAKMSQFAQLWRSFTCGHLDRLLDQEYPDTNLPFVIRTRKQEVVDANSHLDRDFTFVAVVYRRRLPEMLPGLFTNPLASDATAYAQARVFVPRPRLVWWLPPPSPYYVGGLPGEFPTLPSGPDEPQEEQPRRWSIERQPFVSDAWDLVNQHWTAGLVPATTPNLVKVLQTNPPAELVDEEVSVPNLEELSTQDVVRISPH